ncbi:Cof-type HAD-IIB family hydrolase [Silvimonas iriomotensis]|uniref:Pyridoxal phosphatase n=1 Tax=Silvimonas iriomotensis TaxID=449662 RepID=A0ABQ2PC55_9NEIS|nr:Cof-type HAD-IIB family hydrolase [Silvimonas iriomotensis]GGP22926.1 pyridoxal phosphatase [Silvimonas iriomotensis]
MAEVQPALIALDLDGTLLNSQGRIRADSLETLGQARAAGIEIMLVTGRHHIMARPFHQQLPGLPAICCNGASLYDFAEQRALAASPLAPALAQELADWCESHHLHVLVYIDDAMIAAAINAHITGLQAWAAQLPRSIAPEISIASPQSAIRQASCIWKIVASHADPAVLRVAMAHMPLALQKQLSSEWSWHNRVDMVAAGNSKGERLARYCASRGIAAARVMAFGDQQNDLSMLGWAGMGVAMGNAQSVVKTRAWRVTGSNDEGGIAMLLRSVLAGV